MNSRLKKIRKQTMKHGLMNKNDRFTKLQGISLIIATLLISLIGGYFISDKFIWSKQESGSNRAASQLL